MSTKLNIAKVGKIEKDAVYAIKFNRNLSHEELQNVVKQFDHLFKTHGAQFILLGSDMELLDPLSVKGVIIEALHEWEKNKLRIVP
jgi:hypothetical protein